MAARLALVTIAAALVALAAWVWVGPQTSREPLPASAVAGVSTDELCRNLEREAFVMADGLKREFARHRVAHYKFRHKQIPFGPETKRGSVLWIWKDTMHKGAMHDHHYTELRGIMRAKGCLTDVSENPPR